MVHVSLIPHHLHVFGVYTDVVSFADSHLSIKKKTIKADASITVMPNLNSVPLCSAPLSMAQNGFCFDDIYLLAGINLFCHSRAPMWILGDL